MAKDQTYGERQYDFVFNNVINFWINLFVSAGFTYWVNHSKTLVKLPWRAEAERPAELQKAFSEVIRKYAQPLLNRFQPETQQEISGNMAGVATLTAAGHLVMIPSVWLGAKIKAPFVKALNRKHYGDEAMEDPTLKARHAAIEAEERPTLLGAIAGRAGTIVATQTTAYTLGSNVNIIRWIGENSPTKALGFLAKFPGIDILTSQAGDNFGGAITDMIPGRMEKINQAVSKDYTWSLRQVEDTKHAVDPNWKYGHREQVPGTTQRIGGGINEHFGKYLVSDIMYSAVTAATISPAINFMKKFIPGLTYKPVVSAETQALLETTPVRVRANPIADQLSSSEASTTTDASAPSNRVSHVHPQQRVAQTQEQQVTA